MAWMHPLAVEHRRKLYTRQDAWRLAPPGTPEAKMPGWLDPSMMRVRLKEAQEEEARKREAAAQEEFERDLLELRWLVKSLRSDLLMLGLRHKYSPDQPRDELGRWTSGANSVGDAAVANSGDNSLATGEDERTRLAQAGFGTLLAEIPVPGGRRCVYNFGSYSVVVPGPTNFQCQPTVHWSGVVHGRLLNDN
jgi:hypothetical protein